MLIKVKTLTGKEIEVDIEPQDKVVRIKERLEEKEGKEVWDMFQPITLQHFKSRDKPEVSILPENSTCNCICGVVGVLIFKDVIIK